MLEKVRRTIAQYQMCARGDTIVIGLSGGADSVALLHVMHTLAKEGGWRLQAVHVHHGLRAVEADVDASFSAEMARRMEIPCQVVFVDVAAEAKRRNMGTEEAGRLLRYRALEQAAGSDGKIAVAHHANDQAETLLMHLCRGSGMQGLAGMAPVRGNLLRPLLFCSRQEIEAYCLAQGLSYCLDSTNQDMGYTRNRIRHQALPLLEEIYHGSSAHLAETAELLAVEHDLLQQLAAEAFEKAKQAGVQTALSCPALMRMHTALRRRVLRMAVEEVLGNTDQMSRAHLRAVEGLLEKQSGSSVQITKGMTVRRQYDWLLFQKQKKQTTVYAYPLPIGTEVLVKEAGIRIQTGIFTEKNAEFVLDDCTKLLDYDTITQALCCRTRRAGDRIRLPGGTKKLKAFLIDEKIPADRRAEMPLIACGEEIVWIYGGRVSEKFLPSAATTTYVWIRITEESST